MTTKITVSVNGNYKIPVKRGSGEPVIVSGRYAEGETNTGPRSQDFYPTHGDGSTFVIGPEEPDGGE